MYGLTVNHSMSLSGHPSIINKITTESLAICLEISKDLDIQIELVLYTTRTCKKEEYFEEIVL